MKRISQTLLSLLALSATSLVQAETLTIEGDLEVQGSFISDQASVQRSSGGENVYFKWNQRVPYAEVTSGNDTVDNQAIYIEFDDVHVWGAITVTVVGDYDAARTTGMIRKTFAIGRSPGWANGNDGELLEVALGPIVDCYKLGSASSESGKLRIPLYKIKNKRNRVTVFVEGHLSLYSASVNMDPVSDISLTEWEVIGEDHFPENSVLNDAVVLDDSAPETPGAIRYNDSGEFEGYNGISWISLTGSSDNIADLLAENSLIVNHSEPNSGDYSASFKVESNGNVWSGNGVYYDDLNQMPHSSGSRMIWLDDKSAFRAGLTSGFHPAWSYDNIGPVSMAWGENTQATESKSTAWGFYSTASGLSSTAWGVNSKAEKEFSTAWGNGAKASNTSATAWGYYSSASGSNSTAWGRNTKSEGSQATAFGENTVASGHLSTALGESTQALSYGTVALGRFNIGRTTSQPNSIEWESGSRDALFEVGIGSTDTSRANALTLIKDGRIAFGEHDASGMYALQTQQEIVQVQGPILIDDYSQSLIDSGFDPESEATSGAIRYGTNSEGEKDFLGYVEGQWVSLTSGGSGSIQTLSLNESNQLVISGDEGNPLTLPSGTNSSDELISSITLNDDNILTVNEGDSPVTVDLSALAVDNVNDTDYETDNEVVTAVSYDGTTLTITEGGVHRPFTVDLGSSNSLKHTNGDEVVKVLDSSSAQVAGDLDVTGTITMKKQGNISMGDFQ